MRTIREDDHDSLDKFIQKAMHWERERKRILVSAGPSQGFKLSMSNALVYANSSMIHITIDGASFEIDYDKVKSCEWFLNDAHDTALITMKSGVGIQVIFLKGRR